MNPPEERRAFLRSIMANPGCDTTRLVYADWLDANAEGVRDTATAEFIRLGCKNVAHKDRQSVAEGRWLECNWRLLMPGFAGRYVHYRGTRSGRWVHMVAEIPAKLFGEQDTIWKSYLSVEFWRGFVRRVVVDGPIDVEFTTRVLIGEQPLIEPLLRSRFTMAPVLDAPSALIRADLGIAWPFLKAPAGAKRVHTTPDRMEIYDDSLGVLALQAQTNAFRDYARSLARDAGLI